MIPKNTHRPGKLGLSGHSLRGGARLKLCGRCIVDLPRHAFDFLPWERSGRLICVVVRDTEAASAGQMAQKKVKKVPLA